MFPIDMFFTKEKEKEMENEKELVYAGEKRISAIQRLKKIEKQTPEKESPNDKNIILDSEEEKEKNEEEKEKEITLDSLFLDQQNTIQKEEETMENPLDEKQDFQDNSITTSPSNDIKEGKSLFEIILSLKNEKVENEKKIKELIEEKEELRELDSSRVQELEKIREEKEEIYLNIRSLEKIQLKNEKELEKLTEEKNNLYSLTLKTEDTNRIMKEMIHLIGIKTEDLENSEVPVFAENCLSRLKEQIENIAI